MKSRLSTWLGVGALLLLAGILWWERTTPPDVYDPIHENRSADKSRLSDRDDTHLSRNRPDLPPPINDDPDSAEAKHFRNFYLRPIAFGAEMGSDTLSLQECLTLMKDAYVSIARETNEEAVAFHVDLSAANTSKGLRLRAPRASVRMNLQLLAALSGNRLVGTGPNFRFEAISDVTDITGTVRYSPTVIMPDFTSDLKHREALSHFPEPAIPKAPEHASLKDLFDAMEVQLSPALERAISGIMEGKSYVVDQSASDLEILRAVMAFSTFGTQVQTTSKLVKLPADSPLPVEPGPIEEGPLQVLMRKIASQPGVSIETYPTIVARPGESSTVDILQGEPDDLFGVQIGYQTHHLGSGEETYVTMKSSSGPEHDPNGTPPRKITLNGRSTGHPGQSQILTGTDSEGANVMLIHTHTRLDPTDVIIAPALPTR
jgi:hypothetical protein